MTEPIGPASAERRHASPSGVKNASRRRRDFRRHLEGWQLAAGLLVVASLSALLVTPRPVAPSELPLPGINRTLQRQLSEESHRRARAAELEPLPYEVRAVGEAVRDFGLANATQRADRVVEVALDMPRLVRLALKVHGAEPLLRLRALQTQFFLRAVARWQATGEVDRDFQELGGGFAEEASKNGWLSGPHRLTLASVDLPSLFSVRWTGLTGLLKLPVFAPTLNEWRAHYGARLAHHPRESGDTEGQVAAVRALARHDPDYPADLALGILAYRSGRYEEAALRLDSHLQDHPGGRWHLRARNYLTAALDAAGHL